MNKDDRETFTAAVRELIATADDEPQPDTILVRDTPEVRAAAERLHAMRPQGVHAFRTVIDDAIASEPEVVEVAVGVPFRISVATLAFCLGGCILHEESELK